MKATLTIVLTGNFKDEDEAEEALRRRLNDLVNEGNFGDYITLEMKPEDSSRCLHCGELFTQERDIQLCDNCIPLYDLELLWKHHDEREIDALDFNEEQSIRDAYFKGGEPHD